MQAKKATKNKINSKQNPKRRIKDSSDEDDKDIALDAYSD